MDTGSLHSFFFLNLHKPLLLQLSTTCCPQLHPVWLRDPIVMETYGNTTTMSVGTTPPQPVLRRFREQATKNFMLSSGFHTITYSQDTESLEGRTFSMNLSGDALMNISHL